MQEEFLEFNVAQKHLETPHLAFVTEYIRQLAAIEDVRAAGEKELKQGSQDDMFAIAIHNSTAIQLELTAGGSCGSRWWPVPGSTWIGT